MINNRNRIIIALSGGMSSFVAALITIILYKDTNEILLYFNDTKWEHPDLYRFLKDIELYTNYNIIFDNDGRSPEELDECIGICDFSN